MGHFLRSEQVKKEVEGLELTEFSFLKADDLVIRNVKKAGPGCSLYHNYRCLTSLRFQLYLVTCFLFLNA